MVRVVIKPKGLPISRLQCYTTIFRVCSVWPWTLNFNVKVTNWNSLYVVKGLVTRNAHLKYESPIYTGHDVTAKVGFLWTRMPMLTPQYNSSPDFRPGELKSLTIGQTHVRTDRSRPMWYPQVAQLSAGDIKMRFPISTEITNIIHPRWSLTWIFLSMHRFLRSLQIHLGQIFNGPDPPLRFLPGMYKHPREPWMLQFIYWNLCNNFAEVDKMYTSQWNIMPKAATKTIHVIFSLKAKVKVTRSLTLLSFEKVSLVEYKCQMYRLYIFSHKL